MHKKVIFLYLSSSFLPPSICPPFPLFPSSFFYLPSIIFIYLINIYRMLTCKHCQKCFIHTNTFNTVMISIFQMRNLKQITDSSSLRNLWGLLLSVLFLIFSHFSKDYYVLQSSRKVSLTSSSLLTDYNILTLFFTWFRTQFLYSSLPCIFPHTWKSSVVSLRIKSKHGSILSRKERNGGQIFLLLTPTFIEVKIFLQILHSLNSHFSQLIGEKWAAWPLLSAESLGRQSLTTFSLSWKIFFFVFGW